ncbi:MAG: phosphoserine phosphatase SerB [Hyphomicrobiaceae bacterium]
MSQFALSLLCAPSSPAQISTIDARLVASALGATGPVKKLGPGAFEFPIEVASPSDIEPLLQAAKTQIGDAPVDINLLALAGRRKRLLIADMDSTMIQQECIDEIAAVAGVGDHVAGITERAMRGELDFNEALNERVLLLKGLDEAKLSEVFEKRINVMPGARTLVQTMKKNNAFCALVSGGFTFFTTRIAEKIGFDINQANTLEIVDGRLTGQVVSPILGQQAKLNALEKFSAEKKIPIDETLAVGDGANDLAMLNAAGLGVAYHAKPIVAAQARAKIEHNDLTALLYLQGYTHEEMAHYAT